MRIGDDNGRAAARGAGTDEPLPAAGEDAGALDLGAEGNAGAALDEAEAIGAAVDEVGTASGFDVGGTGTGVTTRHVGPNPPPGGDHSSSSQERA